MIECPWDADEQVDVYARLARDPRCIVGETGERFGEHLTRQEMNRLHFLWFLIEKGIVHE